MIATLRGIGRQQWIIRGNHHDAWVNGADDPISGRRAMLEEARVLGELHARDGSRSGPSFIAHGTARSPACSVPSNGWRRTLNELQTARRRLHQFRQQRPRIFHAGGTQDLESFINGVAREIRDPETKSTVFQRAHLAGIADAKNADERGTRSQTKRSRFARWETAPTTPLFRISPESPA